MSTGSNHNISCHTSERNLIIEIENNLRQANLLLEQARQAKQAAELTQKQLEIEREKQRLGAEDVLPLINFENSLVQAQNQEIDAIIGYLNSLTNLRRTISTTLDFWEVN